MPGGCYGWSVASSGCQRWGIDVEESLLGGCAASLVTVVVVALAVNHRGARLAGIGFGAIVCGLVGACASVEVPDPDLLPVVCLESRDGSGCSVRGSGYVFDYRSGTCRRYLGASCVSGNVFETEDDCLNTCVGNDDRP
jgi:hypothetical protein